MSGFFKKVGILLLVMLLLTCVGVSIAMRLAPAITGAFAICLVVAAVAFYLTCRKKTQKKEASNLSSGQERERLSRLSRHYAQAKQELNIPSNVHIVLLSCDLFPAATLTLPHFCWLTDSHLCMFPCWEDLPDSHGLAHYLSSLSANAQVLICLKQIPLGAITYYTCKQTDDPPFPFIFLCYRNAFGNMSCLVFDESSYDSLKALLPNLDLQIILARQYPQSSQQISDITMKMQQLKALRVQSLIDEEEYVTKKNQLLVTL